MKRVKSALSMICVLVLFVTMALSPMQVVRAEEMEEKYQPVDVVLVIDTSGSMKKSDEQRLVMKAIRMFANMMPAEDSRVAIVGFNEEAVSYTTANGKPAFLELKDMKNVKKLRSILNDIKYDGYTGVGNGLKEAVKLIQDNKRDDAQNAILVFSDGVDEMRSQVKYQECQDNLTDALLWASQNNCPIYPLGFDYLVKGGSSLGTEGLAKLDNIAAKSKGFSRVVKNIDDIEDNFVQILADICNLKYVPIGEVPGDGGHHEIPIDVTAGIVEMNIRIACNTAEALKSGTIQLKAPDGTEVDLKDSDDVRYDVEAYSASIKVMKPTNGEWTLILDGIKGDEIKIGLLNHFNIDLKGYAKVPEGNPKNTAYVGDEVQLVCEIESENKQSDMDAVYKELTSVVATVTPRTNPDKSSEVELSYDGTALSGTVKIKETSIYDVHVVVDSPYFKKSVSFEIGSGNKALELTGKKLENQEVKVKKSITVKDIYKCVSDAEGDKITATNVSVEKAKVASAAIKDDKIVIDGLKWGSSIVTVEFTDEQGNTQTVDFSVKVKDPVKVALLSMIPVLLVLIAIAVILMLLQGTRRVSGTFDIGPVVMMLEGNKITIGKVMSFPGHVLFNRNKTMKGFMKKYAVKTKTQSFISQDQYDALDQLFVRAGSDSLANELNGIVFKGTFFGKKGFTMVIPAGLQVALNDQPMGTAMKYKVNRSQSIRLTVRKKNGIQAVINIDYEMRTK